MHSEKLNCKKTNRLFPACSGLCLAIPLALLLSFGIAINEISAQTIPVGDLREEQIRMQQLLYGSEYSSLTNRPVWSEVYDNYMERSLGEAGWWNRKVEPYQIDLDYSFRAGVYEPVFGNTFNTTVPYGGNNAAAWHGRGLTSEFQAGFWITSDFLTITFRPHLAWQQNSDFEQPRFINSDDDGNIFYEAEGIGSRIDRPFRFGPDPYWTTDWGHSSIRLHYEAIEAGLSTEPLWWGGTVQYPLVMSNNAPGMKHLFAGTRKPLPVPWIGSVEFRWMGGFPEDSGYFTRFETYERKRFMNAANVSFTPALSKNFTVGFTRVMHIYRGDHDARDKVTMIFDPVFEKNLEGKYDENSPLFDLSSFYMRWVWPESRTEIYAEIFSQGDLWDTRDFLMNPRHDGGYAFGFQSLFESSRIHYYRVNLEFTNMVPSALELVRPQTYYYADPFRNIGQGHTNRGQVMGAEIGPGSNSQYLQVDAITENGRFGLFIRRFADNNHYHYVRNSRHTVGDWFRHRTDLTIGSNFLYHHEPLTLSGQVSWTKLFNYGRHDYGEFAYWHATSPFEFDKHNLRVQLSVRYSF